MEKHQCEAMVWRDYHNCRCIKNAKYKRDGKWYCTIHDPERIKERDRIALEKYHKEIEEIRKNRERREAEQHYCEHLSTEYLQTHKADSLSVIDLEHKMKY